MMSCDLLQDVDKPKGKHTNFCLWTWQRVEPGWADHLNRWFIRGVSITLSKIQHFMNPAVTPSRTHLECRCSRWLDRRNRAGSGTGSSSRDGRGGLLLHLTARLLLLLLLLGLSTRSLLLGPLPVLLLLLLGDVLEAGLDASCAAAGWRVESRRIKKWVHTLL